MTKAARAPVWLPPLSLLTIAILIGLISFSSWRLSPFAITGQAFLLIVVLRAFCRWPPMVEWVNRMSISHRVVFAVLIASMIMGHFTFETRKCFPFIAWCIFPVVREDDPVTCRQFIATTASGRKVRLLVEQLFPSIVQVYPLDDSHYYPPSVMQDLVRAMAKIYNEHHANDPVRHVDLMVMAVKLHPPANESRAQPSCEFLKRYDISSAR